MIRNLFFYFFLILTFNLNAQVRIFENHDFTKGKYAIVIEDVSEEREQIHLESNFNENKDYVKDYRTHYIIESVEALNKIRNTWVGKESTEKHMCWYNYFIYLTHNDSVISQMKINYSCNELIVGQKSYNFDSTNIISALFYADTLEKIIFKKIIDRDEALKKWKSIEEDSSVVLRKHSRPFWVDYEGIFEIKYSTYDKEIALNASSLVNESIKNEYPNDKFFLKEASMSFGRIDEPFEITFYVICNKSLYDKFTLFRVSKNWKEFDYFQPTYFKIKSRTANKQLLSLGLMMQIPKFSLF